VSARRPGAARGFLRGLLAAIKDAPARLQDPHIWTR
jgi:hypothetical protein